MAKLRILAAITAALLWGAIAPAGASQGSCIMPTTGTVSGLTLVQNMNVCIDAIQTANSGATAPTNTAGSPGIGQLWLRTTDNALMAYDGASWLRIGTLDATAHVWKAPIGQGLETVASATATDLCSVTGSMITITGTTTIAGFSNACTAGQIKAVKFSGALQLTSSAALILPGAANILTVAGDQAVAVYLGGGNWSLLTYQRADGTAVSTSSVFTGAVFFNAPITITLGSNTNDWNPAGLAGANVIALTCSSAINVTGIDAPATDGQVLVIQNVGATNPCTFLPESALSTAANRMAIGRPMVVRPGQPLTLIYYAAATRWRMFSENTAQPVAAAFKNLRVYNVATVFGDSAPATPNNQMTIKADQIVVEDTFGGGARLSTVNCTADITASGAGGLDTGSVAINTWYSEWVIFAPATNTQSCLFSLSATAPTMPAGYSFKTRVGWNRTDASSRLNRLQQYGRSAKYVAIGAVPTSVLPVAASGVVGSITTPTWVAVSTSTFVPSTASDVCMVLSVVPTAIAIVAPNNNYGAVTSTTSPPPAALNMTVTPGGNGSGTLAWCAGLESTNVYWASNGSTNMLQVMGWEDNL